MKKLITKKQAEILKLYLEGFTQKEIAEKTNSFQSNVQVKLRTAIKHLGLSRQNLSALGRYARNTKEIFEKYNIKE